MSSEQPIGFYDSGIGGLTVANAVLRALPNEEVIYFGDSLHFPYGEKSELEIQSYSIEIAKFFLEQNCKCIVIACNSASASAYQTIKDFVGTKAIVVDVIEPTIYYVKEYLSDLNKIGVIATRRTIQSGEYYKGLQAHNFVVKGLATPLLAPMIEEGFVNDAVSKEVISHYLNDQSLQGIQALILACTHYPIIKQQVDEHYNNRVEIIDTPIVIAKYLEKVLSEHNLLRKSGSSSGTNKFYFSELNDYILRAQKVFDYNFEIEEKNIFL